MNIIDYVNAKAKGQFITIRTRRAVDVLKRGGLNGRKVEKESVLQLRVGHSYYNQAATAEKHESGERQIWGLPDYLEHVTAAIVRNKKSGQLYVVGQPSGNPATARFFVDGQEVDKASIEGELTAKEKGGGEKPDHIMIKVDNILEVA